MAALLRPSRSHHDRSALTLHCLAAAVLDAPEPMTVSALCYQISILATCAATRKIDPLWHKHLKAAVAVLNAATLRRPYSLTDDDRTVLKATLPTLDALFGWFDPPLQAAAERHVTRAIVRRAA